MAELWLPYCFAAVLSLLSIFLLFSSKDPALHHSMRKFNLVASWPIAMGAQFCMGIFTGSIFAGWPLFGAWLFILYLDILRDKPIFPLFFRAGAVFGIFLILGGMFFAWRDGVYT